eukprot:scaffold254090_cov18-Tisochrysis_lutea.AAC.2
MADVGGCRDEQECLGKLACTLVHCGAGHTDCAIWVRKVGGVRLTKERASGTASCKDRFAAWRRCMNQRWA